MCGINGIFAYHYASNPVDRAELARTRDHMTARGPDGEGSWMSPDGRLGFGHRRLSIIDLSETGAQPMLSADGRFAVVLNGEIYNYRAIRRRLEAKGYTFRSQSDTEVLLHLYAERGEEMVHELRGMFAFGLWDEGRRRLLLVRDPHGIKPLYYADDGWTLRFASQVKALMAGGKIANDPDPAGCVGFHLWGSVPEPFTTVLAIRNLPAGCHLSIDSRGAGAPVRYNSIGSIYCAPAAGTRQPDADRALHAALLDSVRHHLVADVSVGAFLSGGVDSGALVGLMRDAGQDDIQTVTLTFDEYRGSEDDEAPIAAQVAAHYGTRHTTRVVSQAEFQDDLPRILDAMDQPSIDGINTWFVSKAARELGLKVAISGLGGDELFGGYPSFRDIPRWVRWLRVPSRVPLLGVALRHAFAASRAIGLRPPPKMAGVVSLGGSYAGAYLLRRGLFMPWELDTLLDRDLVREGLRRMRPVAAVDEALTPRPKSSFRRVASLETQLYMRNQLLRDTDWASMAHGIEVRVPLVDAHLLKTIAPLLGEGQFGDGKRRMASAPTRPLPSCVLSRPKSGFSMPISAWHARSGRPGDTARPVASNVGASWSRRWALHVAASHAVV